MAFSFSKLLDRPANEAEYLALIANAAMLSHLPTVIEIQAKIDEVNAGAAVLLQISSFASGGNLVSAVQHYFSSGATNLMTGL